MGKKLELAGQRFGRLVVLWEWKTRKHGVVYWECLCDCGNINTVIGKRLKSGAVKQCIVCVRESVKLKLSGQRFNRLVVLWEYMDENQRRVLWECLCDCGSIVRVRSDGLKSGRTKSCGCYSRELFSEFRIGAIKRKDESGKKFGRLIVMDYAYTKKNRAYWNCICDCGNKSVVDGIRLRGGITQSCGCYNVDKVRDSNFKDLQGQEFGWLTVLKYAGISKSGRSLWYCVCKCGEYKTVPGTYLISGGTQSCGCYKRMYPSTYQSGANSARWNPDREAVALNRKVAQACGSLLRNCLIKSNQKKTASTAEMLGYTTKELREHLESQFTDGMAWMNHGEWHIDHIKPIKAFLDESITDPKIINALDNLQPLWAYDNLSKGATYNPLMIQLVEKRRSHCGLR